MTIKKRIFVVRDETNEPAAETPVVEGDVIAKQDEAVVKLDAKPIESFTDALAGAMGLPTEAEKATAEDHFNEPFMVSSTYSTMLISELRESETNPRKAYENLEELAASIEKVGVLVPLLVRPVKIQATGFESDTMVHEVVAGHRRLRAAKAAGLTEVPVDVRELTDVQALEVQLTENIQRADLSPMEEATGYDALMKLAGYTADQVAQKAGKSRGWVYARLKLLALAPEGVKALEGGKLNTTVAVALARVPSPKDQGKALEKLEGMPTREALSWLQKEFCVSLKGAPFDRKDDMLLEGTPACSACPKRSGSAPGVYDDLGNDWCTDVKCYAAKARATWDIKSAKHEKAGATVLSIDEGRKLFKNENALGYGSKYVLADEAAVEDRSKRTWAQLLEKVPAEDQPMLFVAPDLDMVPKKLFVEKDALHAIAKHLKLAWAERGTEKKQQREERSDPGKAHLEAQARAIRDEVVREVLFAAGAKVRKEGITAPWARLVARALHHGGGFDEYLASRKVEPRDAEKWLAEASVHDASGYVVAHTLQQWLGNTYDDFQPEVLEVAKLLGLDLDAMVRAKVEDVAPEKDETKKAKKERR